MTPQQYDAWYAAPRGAWIGELEYRLLQGMLRPAPGSSILDVGCGTGYFSRRFALEGHAVTGIDVDPATIDYARGHAAAREQYAVADALALPFEQRRFDYCISVTALCFLPDERKALEEIVRVARKGIAVGLLNRRSLLYLKKGRGGGSGAYRGAHWHTPGELRVLLNGLPVAKPQIRSAVFLPSGGAAARRLEALIPGKTLLGGFLAASADLA
ncbi:MAG: class I SAM-dependent methyltransferase [Pseudomonadota bacterium]